MTKSKLNERDLSRLIYKVLNEQYKESEGFKHYDLLVVYMNGDQNKKGQILVKNPYTSGGEKRANFKGTIDGKKLDFVGPYNSQTLEFKDPQGNTYKVIQIANSTDFNRQIASTTKPATPTQPKKNLALSPDALKRVGIKEQKNVEGRCRPDQVKKILSTLNASRKFSIEVSEKDPNEIRVKDADGRSECLVRRNQIFKSA
jgi:hypothetical protein